MRIPLQVSRQSAQAIASQSKNWDETKQKTDKNWDEGNKHMLSPPNINPVM
jgi:hypothetical protein